MVASGVSAAARDTRGPRRLRAAAREGKQRDEGQLGWVTLLLLPRWMFPCCSVHDLEERRSWQRRVSAAGSGDPRRQRPCLSSCSLWHWGCSACVPALRRPLGSRRAPVPPGAGAAAGCLCACGFRGGGGCV